MLKMENKDYLALMKRDYPEELEPGRMVDTTRQDCAYMVEHPEMWEREAKWFREMYREDPEQAILKYVYELLESFA